MTSQRFGKALRFLVQGVAAFAIVASAGASAAKADQAKIDAIWDVANLRVNRQLEVWYEDGDFPRMTQALRFQYSLYPEDYEIATNLGFLLESIGYEDEALAIYIKHRRKNPNDPDAALPEATFYFQKRVYAKVLPLLEPAIKKEDAHANVWRLLANSYERMNLLADSKRVWQRYLQKAPNDATAKRNLARVEKKIKDSKKK